MGDVVDIDTARPHCQTLVECQACGHQWRAVYPDTAKSLECPNCYTSVNEFGTPVYVGCCRVCGKEFTVCPAPETIDEWQECLGEECDSYDESRDADKLFDAGLVKRDDEMPE